MQVSATLIAAQQAAREAQVRFHAVHVTQQPVKAPTAPQASFSAALGQPESFSPLFQKAAPSAPAPQSKSPQAAPAQAGQQAARLGANLDITI